MNASDSAVSGCCQGSGTRRGAARGQSQARVPAVLPGELLPGRQHIPGVWRAPQPRAAPLLRTEHGSQSAPRTAPLPVALAPTRHTFQHGEMNPWSKNGENAPCKEDQKSMEYKRTLGEGKARCPFGNVLVHKLMLSFAVFTKELILGTGIFLCLSNKTQDFLSKWMFPKSIKSTKGLGTENPREATLADNSDPGEERTAQAVLGHNTSFCARSKENS